MSATKKIIEEVRHLPEPLAQEVLNFVRKLTARSETDASQDLKPNQQPVMDRIWSDPSDDVWDEL